MRETFKHNPAEIPDYFPLDESKPKRIAQEKLIALEHLSQELSKLPDRPRDSDSVKGGYKHKSWTEVEDLALLDFWPIKVQSDVARILKRSVRSCIDRYAYLKSLQNKCL